MKNLIEKICCLPTTLYIRMHVSMRKILHMWTTCVCTKDSRFAKESGTSIGRLCDGDCHESTSEGKSSSGGWSGLAAFYHILLYMREHFFPWTP